MTIAPTRPLFAASLPNIALPAGEPDAPSGGTGFQPVRDLSENQPSARDDMGPPACAASPDLTTSRPDDLTIPEAQQTLREVLVDCGHLLTDLQQRLLAYALDREDVDGVATVVFEHAADSLSAQRDALVKALLLPSWTAPTAMQVAREFCAIAERGFIVIATIGTTDRFLAFVGAPHALTAVHRAAARAMNLDEPTTSRSHDLTTPPTK